MIYLEAYLTSCTFDYMSEDFDNHLFVASIFSCSYVFPLIFMIVYYSRIVSHVVAHEKALKEQVSWTIKLYKKLEIFLQNTGISRLF